MIGEKENQSANQILVPTTGSRKSLFEKYLAFQNSYNFEQLGASRKSACEPDPALIAGASITPSQRNRTINVESLVKDLVALPSSVKATPIPPSDEGFKYNLLSEANLALDFDGAKDTISPLPDVESEIKVRPVSRRANAAVLSDSEDEDGVFLRYDRIDSIDKGDQDFHSVESPLNNAVDNNLSSNIKFASLLDKYEEDDEPDCVEYYDKEDGAGSFIVSDDHVSYMDSDDDALADESVYEYDESSSIVPPSFVDSASKIDLERGDNRIRSPSTDSTASGSLVFDRNGNYTRTTSLSMKANRSDRRAEASFDSVSDADSLIDHLIDLSIAPDIDCSTLAEESISIPKEPSTALKQRFTKSYRERRTVELFAEYNDVVFDQQLPSDLPIGWSSRLLTTAGITRYQDCENRKSATIELSEKVLDCDERLEQTLLHELCHVAAWLIDGVRKPPHGAIFKKWGKRVTSRYPHITVTTCHSYKIRQPHKFQCSNSACGKIYSRHSKRGVDVNKSCCGVCQNKLEYVGKELKDGTLAQPCSPKGFSAFVKVHFAAMKAQLGAHVKHGEVMRALSTKYKSNHSHSSDQQFDSSSPSSDEVILD